MKLKIIELDRIKELFFLKKDLYYENCKNIEKSIIENGFIYPIRCFVKSDFYYIVDGFKRIVIAKNLNLKDIPVILENYNSEILIFIKHLKYNISRNFSPLEISNFLNISINYFNNEILCEYILNKIYGKSSKKIINDFLYLNNLIENGKKLLINEKLNLNIAFKIATLDNNSQKLIIKVIENLKLNSNKQKKIYEYLFNLSKRYEKTIYEIINKNFAKYCEEKYSKKLEDEFFDKLEKLHSPDYYEFHKKFLEKKNKILKNIKGINIYSPVNYEDDIFKAEIYFKDFNDLGNRLKKLLSRLIIEN